MNHALSQRASGKHPVGLLVVVGLHVLLAAVLLSARIVKTPPVDPPSARLLPPTATPPKHIAEPLPVPRNALPQRHDIIVPEVPLDPQQPPTVIGKADPTPQPSVSIAPAETGPVTPTVARIQPHAAVINAGASQCRPAYPAAAVRAGTTGVAKIRFRVDAGGKVSNALILAGSGPTREHRMLDKAAADALQQCPITVGTDKTGRPVGTTTDVEYVWRLD